ncbi:DUF1694 domain-containing protein [Peribacillus tepidiphilus]|uniref:DUF1694 domain-containing protein n=1 Tax=Peribacillus tepidiphilus TaxID=2652445 RepID=UPI0035B532F7
MRSLEDFKVHEYLLQGIHGKKETNPEERKKFLGTIRERIVFVLTQAQVMKDEIIPKAEALMQENFEAHLYLNGHIRYPYLAKYIALASKLKMDHTIVTNKEYHSDIGLVLAYEHAIDREEIYIKEPKQNIQKIAVEKDKGFLIALKKIFNKK